VGSQHHAAALDTRWFKDAFAQAVTRIGHTLLVLQPWHDPLPLKRSWCLWEIHSTLNGGKELQIVLSPAQRKAFQDSLVPEHSPALTRGGMTNRLMGSQVKGFDTIQAALSKIDVRTASAYNEADKHMIETAVRDSAGGFEAVNGRIHYRMREWLAQAARELVAHMRGKLGDKHPETLKSMEKLAMLLNVQGKLREAEPLYRDVLRCRRETLGNSHPLTLGTMNNLGVLLKGEGVLGEAESLHREALDCQRTTLGNNHPDTLTSMSNLASLLETKGEHSEAEQLVQNTLSCQRAMLGDTHPETLASMNSLAILLNTQGKLSEAEPLLCNVLRIRRETLGNSHPLTLLSIVNLAALLRDQEKLSEAAPLFRDALHCQRELLGNTHPDTLTSMNNLAVLLNELGEQSEAETLCREARRVRCETLGNLHPETLMSVNNLAWILHTIPGSTAEAVLLAREAVRGFEAPCNVMHAVADKLNALDTLAAALEADGQAKEAAAVRARIASSAA
jgi:tetratricopeptide (TPR) repeat protein